MNVVTRSRKFKLWGNTYSVGSVYIGKRIRVTPTQVVLQNPRFFEYHSSKDFDRGFIKTGDHLVYDHISFDTSL